MAWTKLIYALRDPRCTEAITKHGLPADAIMEGISLRMPVMAWKFNGIVITVGVYQSVLASASCISHNPWRDHCHSGTKF